MSFRPMIVRRPKTKIRRTKVLITPLIVDFQRRYADARGLYRTFNAATYRFYRSNSGPPAETDNPFATSASLPDEPADTYADGTWYLSMSYFNGVIDSGFLPVGPAGETYLRLDLSGGAEVGNPPAPPSDWRIEQLAGGVIRIVATYIQTDANRATEWAIAYTTDGSTPATDTPDVTVTMTTAGLSVLSYDLPSQSNGTTVKVRLQTRRSTFYSEGSIVKTLTADATGPDAPLSAERWPGQIPKDT